MKTHMTGKSISTVLCPHCNREDAVPMELVKMSIFGIMEDDKFIKSIKLTQEKDDWNKDQYPYMICKCECLNCDETSYAKIAITIDVKDILTGKHFYKVMEDEGESDI